MAVFHYKIITAFYIPLLCHLISPVILCAQPETPPYQFKESIDLIRFVEDAAMFFSEKGKDAFQEFSEENSKWFSANRYIFIYDLEGICIFHPVEKDLEGQNLIDFRDINGKPVIKFIISIVTRPDKPYGWVHYLWATPGEIFPSWKNAYVMRVKSPEGKAYAIGSGTYNIRNELRFVVSMVDSAARMIESEGAAAYRTLIDKSSIFYFQDSYTFVMSTEGKMLADPSYPSTTGRDISKFQDYADNLIISELITRLEDHEEVYLSYKWPAPGQTNPSKKIMYARKVQSGDETVIVGSSLYIMEPIWKKF
jgi:signal transduction histidine kinase